MKRKAMLVFVISELITISFLTYKIYKQKKIGGVSTTTIQKNDIVFNKNNMLPKYFYEPKPGEKQVAKIKGYLTDPVTYTINSDGLNERYDYELHKPEHTFRIITMGDSFTFGQFVNTEENYSEILENKLNSQLNCEKYQKFEVINLGVYGYDIQYSVERFKIRGKKYNPDLVLWFLKDDDFYSVNEYEIPKEKLIAEEMGLDRNSKEYVYNNGIAYPSWQKTHKLLLQEWGEDNLLLYQTKFLYELNKHFNGSLVIFTYPYTTDKYKLIVKKFINQEKRAYFFDGLHPLYDIKTAIFPDSHPNKKGHQIIAEDLFNYLTKNKIIPCN